MLDKAGNVFRWFGGAFVPMFLKPTAPVGLAWFLHALIVTGFAVGLYFAQPHLGVTGNLGQGPAWFRPFWLVAIFYLVLMLLWAAAWLFKLLAPNQPEAIYPDIDQAWIDILSSLEKSGIGIADTPVFLVLGDHPNGLEPFFRALPNGLMVAGGSSPDSPLRAYANRDCIYVTLPGATLLGIQDATELTIAPADQQGGESIAFKSVGIDASIGIGQSVGAGASIGASIGGGGGALQEIQRIIRTAKNENRPLSEEERNRVRELSGGPSASAPAAKATSKAKANAPSVLQNPDLVNAAADRLIHVCSLITAARWPLCPINGALLAVPVEAGERDDLAQQWGLVARQDLMVLEYGLKMRFPVFAVIGGIEQLAGGVKFFEKFSIDKANQRLGKGFPFNPEVRPENLPPAVESMVNWVFGGLLGYWAMKLTRIDGREGTQDTKENAQLVKFLAEIKQRGPNFARLLSRAMAPGDSVPVFGGCYLSVVMPGEPDKAKFAREFFKKVESSQGYVAWTDAAFDQDASYRGKTKLGYMALIGIVAVVVGLAVYVFASKGGKA